jgi:hypothetical protein
MAGSVLRLGEKLIKKGGVVSGQYQWLLRKRVFMLTISVSSVSGMLTKQGFGAFFERPLPWRFVFEDVTATVAQLDPPLEVDTDYRGAAVIAAYTVLFNGDSPWRLVAICDTASEVRTVATSEDAALMARAMGEECCGRKVLITAGGMILA